MLKFKRTNALDDDFQKLVKSLDIYLAKMDGDEHAFYDQYNQLDDIKYVLVAYIDDEAVGCGAIKKYSDTAMEVKRMFVQPTQRGAGIGAQILSALEAWTTELNMTTCVLETGKKQVEAIALYKKCGYQQTPNYGQYQGMANSLCFEKSLA